MTKVPYLNLTVMSSRYHLVENQRTFGQNTNPVCMTWQSSDQRLCEDFVELRGIFSSSKLSSAGEGMLSVGSAGDFGDGGVSDSVYLYH